MRADRTAAVWLNEFVAGHQWLADAIVAVERAVVALVAVCLLALLARRSSRRAHLRALLASLAAAAVAFVTSWLLGLLNSRQRPFVDEPERVELLIPHAADAGFPSQHAAVSFAIATVLALLLPRTALLALALAALIAVGRIAVGVHYPIDVLAGAVIGCATAFVVIAAQTRLIATRRNWGQRRAPRHADR